MVYMSRNAAIIKLNLLQSSSAVNYFETYERLFLKNLLDNLQKSTDDKLDENTVQKIESLFQKYQKYI